MRALRNPVALFLAIGLLTVIVVVFGTSKFADQAATDQAITEARNTTQILAQSVIGPEMPARLVQLRPGNLNKLVGKLDAFDRKVHDRLLMTDRPFRINLWSEDGHLIYSTQIDLLLRSLDDVEPLRLDASQLEVLATGGVDSEVADPSRPTDLAAAGTEGMVRIYTRFFTPDPDDPGSPRQESDAGQPVLFEAYFTLDELSDRRSQIFDSFRWITLSAVTLLIGVTTFLLIGLTRELRRASAERERLLLSAMEASDAERRRIARDLHDSVVQDLAGTAYAVTAVARAPGTAPEARTTLDDAGTALRGTLKSLRAILAEIHPPDLHAGELPAALADLIAPAAGVGIQASVSVEGVETTSDLSAGLVWRVAQEAVRNSIRHSQASTLAVTVRSDGSQLTLEVVDDGIGFAPDTQLDADHYGLRGLRSLVRDTGGSLEVRSAPGEGTTVWMEVEAQ